MVLYLTGKGLLFFTSTPGTCLSSKKFKAERAPLVSDNEVKRLKDKFGHIKQSKATSVPASFGRKPANQTFVIPLPCV